MYQSTQFAEKTWTFVSIYVEWSVLKYAQNGIVNMAKTIIYKGKWS